MLMQLMPSLSLVQAWHLPWDYAVDLAAAAGRMADREGERTAAPVDDVAPIQMSDGRHHHPSFSKLAALLGM